MWEEEEEVDELDEIGAEEPQSSLQSGHVCRSVSGNEAICIAAINSFDSKRELVQESHLGVCSTEKKIMGLR